MSEVKVMSLRDVCHVYQPETISKKSLPKNGTYPVYGANGKIGLNDKFNHELPQLLLGCRGTVGSIHISEPYSWINGNAMVVEPFEDLIIRDYLMYALMGGINIKGAVSGTAQPQITRESLSPVQIPIPTLENQRQIVEKLNKSFFDINLLEKNYEKSDLKLDELLQSLLSFSFKSKTSVKNTKSDASRNETEIEILKLGDVVSFDKNQGHFDAIYVGLEDIEARTGRHVGTLEPRRMKSNTFAFTADHLLYGRLRPYLNKVLLPEFSGHCSTEIFPMRVSKDISREYLAYWLRMPSTVEAIDKTSTGSRMPRADMESVLKFEIPVPSLDVQIKIVMELDNAFAEIESMQVQVKKAVNYVAALRQSLLNNAFTNEIGKSR